MKAVVTGSTGLIGSNLVEKLPLPAVLSRNPSRASKRLGVVHAYGWDPEGSRRQWKP